MPPSKAWGGAQSVGANVVSFQKNRGFDSYGKEQGFNVPVGKRAAFAYTTALNHLLAKDSKQRLQVGDASTVFWAEKASTIEPVAVFQTLMRLKNHHLSKLENWGRAVNLERLVGEIMDGVNNFPPVLSLPNQGRFTIGYYHQRQALLTKQS